MAETVFPYPGGKGKFAGWIISHFPDHESYIEPFGGAAAVLHNKEPSKLEVYNDLDGDVAHFFRTLRDHGDEVQEFLSGVPFDQSLYEKWTRQWYEGWRPVDDIKRASIFYFSRYAQWGGKYEGVSGFARATNSKSKAETWASKKRQLTDFRSRWERVTIESIDYSEVFEKYDHDEALFYCDPPYMDTEHRYLSSATGFSHEEFVDHLLDLEGDWLVSYGVDVPERLEDHDQTRVESQQATRGIDRAGGREGKEAQETLVMSYDHHREEGELLGQATAEDATEVDW